MNNKNNQFLFSSEVKKGLFGKKVITKFLLDTNLLWVKGYELPCKRFLSNPKDFKMKYSDIQSINLIEGRNDNSILIIGRPYKMEKTVTIHLPNIIDAKKAVETLTKTKEEYDRKCLENIKELELIEMQKLVKLQTV